MGWEAGVRLGASVGAATEETSVTSPPPPSPSPPEEEGGVCSKNVPSSVGEERREGDGERRPLFVNECGIVCNLRGKQVKLCRYFLGSEIPGCFLHPAEKPLL